MPKDKFASSDNSYGPWENSRQGYKNSKNRSHSGRGNYNNGHYDASAMHVPWRPKQPPMRNPHVMHAPLHPYYQIPAPLPPELVSSPPLRRRPHTGLPPRAPPLPRPPVAIVARGPPPGFGRPKTAHSQLPGPPHYVRTSHGGTTRYNAIPPHRFGAMHPAAMKPNFPGVDPFHAAYHNHHAPDHHANPGNFGGGAPYGQQRKPRRYYSKSQLEKRKQVAESRAAWKRLLFAYYFFEFSPDKRREWRQKGKDEEAAKMDDSVKEEIMREEFESW